MDGVPKGCGRIVRPTIDPFNVLVVEPNDFHKLTDVIPRDKSEARRSKQS
jgi:hypothetical protein